MVKMGLLDTIIDAAKRGAGLLAPTQADVDMRANMPGLIADFTPIVGDAKSVYDGVQSARQGDWLGAGLGALGALPFVPALGTKFYHGSKSGVDWLINGEKFSQGVPSANMKSKYLWANPKREIAENYAGISDMALWKAENGMGSPPLTTAGVASFEINPVAKKYKLTKFDQIAKDYGIDTKQPDWLEKFMDALRKDGYDALVNSLDGGNVAILNPDVVIKTTKVK